MKGAGNTKKTNKESESIEKKTETLNKRPHVLTEEELGLVSGGAT